MLFFWRQGLLELRLGSCSSGLSSSHCWGVPNFAILVLSGYPGIAELTLVSQLLSAGEAGAQLGLWVGQCSF